MEILSLSFSAGQTLEYTGVVRKRRWRGEEGGGREGRREGGREREGGHVLQS